MRKRMWLFVAAGGALPSAAAADPVRIDYFLPTVGVAAAVQQRITRCPASAVEQAAAIGRAGTDPESQPIKVGFDFQVGLSARQQPRRLPSRTRRDPCRHEPAATN